jgi:hypothetical protein
MISIDRRGQPYGGMKPSLRWKLIPHWSNGEPQTPDECALFAR